MSTKDRAADARLRREFHITLAEYNRVLALQKGKCAICKKPPTNRRLAVDHRHGDGLLRGLLCWTCNKFVLGAKDDPQLFFEAYAYLMEPPFRAALGKERFTAPGRVGTKKRKKLLQQMSAVKYLSAPPMVKVLGERFTAPGKCKTKQRLRLLTRMRSS